MKTSKYTSCLCLAGAIALGLAQAGLRVAAAELPSRRAETDELLDAARVAGLQDKIAAIDCDVSNWTDCDNAVKAAIAPELAPPMPCRSGSFEM